MGMGSEFREERGGAEDILGRDVSIGGVDVRVIGVAPPGVIGTRLDMIPAAFLPLPQVRTTILHHTGLLPSGDGDGRLDIGWLQILARMTPADSLQAAAQRLQADALTAGETVFPIPPRDTLQVSLPPLGDAVVPFTSRVELVGSTRLFLTASLAFLLLGATTFAMVALLHLETRRGELAMRLALGANRWRIANMACAELLAVMLIAVALAFPVAAMAMRLLRDVLLPGGISIASLGLTLDGTIVILIGLAGLLALAFVSTLVGLGVAGYLREGVPIGLNLAGTSTIAPRLRRGLVAVLLSVAIVLIGGAVFTTRTVSRILAIDLKHDADRVLYVRYALAEYGYTALQYLASRVMTIFSLVGLVLAFMSLYVTGRQRHCGPPPSQEPAGAGARRLAAGQCPTNRRPPGCSSAQRMGPTQIQLGGVVPTETQKLVGGGILLGPTQTCPHPRLRARSRCDPSIIESCGSSS